MTRSLGTEPPHPHLRLVVEPVPDAHHAWLARAEREGRQFLSRYGHLLSDPSLAEWVTEHCAELVWEARDGEPAWAALRITDVWLRLGNLHRFFPQPRLVVAFYETLRAFLPWLSARGELEREQCSRMLEQLEFVRSPMLERAREQLALRHRFRDRQRRW
ncbi:MAG: hypothetical protein RLZZ450_4217 [Pseudomonadota bacterium]|jgi:hypothetical protein